MPRCWPLLVAVQVNTLRPPRALPPARAANIQQALRTEIGSNPNISRVSGKPVGSRMNKGFAAFAPNSNLRLCFPLLVKYPGKAYAQ